MIPEWTVEFLSRNHVWLFFIYILTNGYYKTKKFQVPLGSIVELVIIDEGLAYDANHPIHMHGYKFRVVAMEKVGENVTVQQIKTMEAEGKITRNLLDAPLKDTVTVPDGGYTIVRLEANNPG